MSPFPVVLTAHYNNLNFITMLNQEVSSSSPFYFSSFMPFFKVKQPLKYTKHCIYLVLTPSFISLNKTRLKTNPQSIPNYYFSPDWYTTVCPSASTDSMKSCAPPASSTLLFQVGLSSSPVIKCRWIISTAFPLMPILIINFNKETIKPTVVWQISSLRDPNSNPGCPRLEEQNCT